MTDGQNLADRFAKLSTATLTAILGARDLSRIFMYGVLPLPGSSPRLAGPAFTMRSVASREDFIRADKVMDPRRNLQRRAAEECPPGAVLVIDCRGDARGASGGAILFERMRIRGCAGVVTDGGVRDAGDIVASGYPVYAKAICPPNSLVAHRFVDLDVPVTCGGVAVYPGDFIVGDAEGVVVIPADAVDDVLREAEAYEDREAFIIERIRSGASIFGNYPLEGEAFEAYERSRRASKD